jgi:hypothetical protein
MLSFRIWVLRFHWNVCLLHKKWWLQNVI